MAFIQVVDCFFPYEKGGAGEPGDIHAAKEGNLIDPEIHLWGNKYFLREFFEKRKNLYLVRKCFSTH